MNLVLRGIEQIKYVLTWVFVLFTKRTTLKGQKEITLPHKTIRVYTFDKDSPGLAQATLFGTIIWNLHWTEGLSVQAQQLLLTHEESHKNRNIIWKGIIYALIILLLIVTYQKGQLILETGFGGLSAAMLIDTIGSLTIPFVTSLIAIRVEEIIADYQSLQELGEEHFIEGYRELLEQGDSTITGRIVRKFLYNHPKQTVKLHDMLNS
jgi:hypothetical protein